MYCSCTKPNIVINSAMGESFEVCSEKLGGCGKEVRNTPPEVTELQYAKHKPCSICEGSGVIMDTYLCGICNGNGTTDLDEEF